MICDHAKSLVLVSVLGVFAVSVSSLRFVETRPPLRKLRHRMHPGWPMPRSRIRGS